jgi:DNA polymerase III epsilon subunit-like protein
MVLALGCIWERCWCFFYGKTGPISDIYVPEALAVSNITREAHLMYSAPLSAMVQFKEFIDKNTNGKPIFVSDNPAFDWQFINYYFHRYLGENPFGFSVRRIGDFYAGTKKDWYAANKWKYLRNTKHTHNPVDDARGNAEALIKIMDMI